MEKKVGRKTLWKYFKVMLLIGLIVLVVIFIRGIVQTFQASNEYYQTDNKITPSDSSLILSINPDKMSNVSVFKSKFRRPVTFLVFDKRYSLAWYMVDSAFESSLNGFVNLEQDDQTANGHPYRVMTNSSGYLFKYKTGLVDTFSHLYISLSGDSIEELAKNDSLISIHLLCNNFSVRYSESGPVDLIFEASRENYIRHFISLDLLLLKQKKSLYLFFLTPLDRNDVVSPDLLNEIILRKS